MLIKEKPLYSAELDQNGSLRAAVFFKYLCFLYFLMFVFTTLCYAVFSGYKTFSKSLLEGQY